MTSSCNVDASQKKPQYTLHPFELAFCGYSGSGKTTLLEKILRRLSSKYNIACCKSDAHRIEIDKEGKDTDRFSKAGAQQVFIHSSKMFANIQKGEQEIWDQRTHFLQADWLFVEGWKDSTIPKILILDDDGQLEDKIKETPIPNIKVLLYSTRLPTKETLANLGDPKVLQRDQEEEITQWIEEYMCTLAKQVPLFGLVLAGGKSSRMGEDKASLAYHSLNQAEQGLQLLKPFCESTFLSRAPQQKSLGISEDTIIRDVFLDMGPMSGILSAFREYPQAAWLVIACDLPLLDQNTLLNLVKNRNPFQTATAYLDSKKKFPEPLCTIYEPKSFARGLHFLAQGFSCPRKILINSTTTLLPQLSSQSLQNANTPEERSTLLGSL